MWQLISMLCSAFLSAVIFNRRLENVQTELQMFMLCFIKPDTLCWSRLKWEKQKKNLKHSLAVPDCQKTHHVTDVCTKQPEFLGFYQYDFSCHGPQKI